MRHLQGCQYLYDLCYLSIGHQMNMVMPSYIHSTKKDGHIENGF